MNQPVSHITGGMKVINCRVTDGENETTMYCHVTDRMKQSYTVTSQNETVIHCHVTDRMKQQGTVTSQTE